ncbi:MAG TPA: hypothetical protein VLG37_02715 [Candidatus Saccharimonadales bacterium]|nr:hypothetical protein [Candidatus Saccharimonadales bacterium]
MEDYRWVGEDRIAFGLDGARQANMFFGVIKALEAGETTFCGVSIEGHSVDEMRRRFEKTVDESGALIGRETGTVATPEGLKSTVKV